MRLMSMRTPAMVFLLSISVLATVNGQVNQNDAEAANTVFTNGEWLKAVDAYKALVKREPTNALYWYRIGAAYHSIGQFHEAIDSYKQAQAISSSPATMYNIACSYSRLNDKEGGLQWLKDAAAAGFNQAALLASDADLENIRSDTRFPEIVALVQKNAIPCAENPLHRQLDFWVGEWDVRNQQGQPVGQSNIERILNGCVILENWVGVRGYEGKSFNFVDPVSGKWRQTWVDDKGGKIEFTGALEGKDMIYFADVVEEEKEFRRRLTFFDLGPDRVRQFSERTYDNGATWHTEYDFIYVRRR